MRSNPYYPELRIHRDAIDKRIVYRGVSKRITDHYANSVRLICKSGTELSQDLVEWSASRVLLASGIDYDSSSNFSSIYVGIFEYGVGAHNLSVLSAEVID